MSSSASYVKKHLDSHHYRLFLLTEMITEHMVTSLRIQSEQPTEHPQPPKPKYTQKKRENKMKRSQEKLHE